MTNLMLDKVELVFGEYRDFIDALYVCFGAKNTKSGICLTSADGETKTNGLVLETSSSHMENNSGRITLVIEPTKREYPVFLLAKNAKISISSIKASEIVTAV